MIRLRNLARPTLVHAVLLAYTVLALFPIFLVVINSFKSKRAIFNDPLALPTPSTFSLVGYQKVLQESEVLTFFSNSLIVTLVSLLLILTFGAMAAWGLSEYKFRGNRWLYFIMGFGIMVPIRLGTVSILSTMVSLNLTNTLTALILVYTAQGLPLAVFILAEFMSQIPKDLKEAARCDSVSEYRIFAQIMVPLIRPAIATVAVFSMIPIWNDLWFPLILAPGQDTQTITLGVQQFIGQYTTNWNAVLASLSLAVLPVVGLYFVFSRQLIRGITSGAVK
jgi:raffinose/stachyose/melibiose transport system permease protein